MLTGTRGAKLCKLNGNVVRGFNNIDSILGNRIKLDKGKPSSLSYLRPKFQTSFPLGSPKPTEIGEKCP